MLEIRTVFEILPIKPNFTKKQVKKAGNKLLARYKPDKVRRVKPDELKDKLMTKYREVFKLANNQLTEVKKGNVNYNIPDAYNGYINSYRQELRNYNESDFKIILKANDLPTDGNKTQLQNRILENVPSFIASLNLEEDYLREQYVPSMEDILKEEVKRKGITVYDPLFRKIETYYLDGNFKINNYFGEYEKKIEIIPESMLFLEKINSNTLKPIRVGEEREEERKRLSYCIQRF